jgi:hypothetical protein
MGGSLKRLIISVAWSDQFVIVSIRPTTLSLSTIHSEALKAYQRAHGEGRSAETP